MRISLFTNMTPLVTMKTETFGARFPKSKPTPTMKAVSLFLRVKIRKKELIHQSTNLSAEKKKFYFIHILRNALMKVGI